MNYAKRLSGLAAALVALGCVSIAQADNCGGRYNNFNVTVEAVEVVKGYSVAMSSNRHAVTSENSPYTGLGYCVNNMLTFPDGKMRLTYTCIEKDKDGDSWTHSGGLEPGADKGSWTQVAGTGKFANKVGSGGWWQGTIIEEKVLTGVWGGTCK